MIQLKVNNYLTYNIEIEVRYVYIIRTQV